MPWSANLRDSLPSAPGRSETCTASTGSSVYLRAKASRTFFAVSLLSTTRRTGAKPPLGSPRACRVQGKDASGSGIPQSPCSTRKVLARFTGKTPVLRYQSARGREVFHAQGDAADDNKLFTSETKDASSSPATRRFRRGVVSPEAPG